MRILFPTTEFPPCLGGVATLAWEQAHGLRALGEELWVETLESSGTPIASTAGFEVRYLRLQARAIARLLPLSANLWRASGRFQPDFICCPTYRGYGLPVEMVARLRGVGYSIYLHGTEINTEVRSAARRSAMSLVLAEASFVAVNSHNTRRLLLERFPKLSQRVIAIHPGVDASKFAGTQVETRAGAIRAQWLERLCAGRDVSAPVVFLSLCRLSRQKGVDLALRAFAQVVGRNPACDALYIIAGSGPEEAEFRHLAEELGVAERVLFLGRVAYETTPEILRAADVYLQPSQPVGDFLESFGISFLEAQAAGLPCIGTQWGGVPEAVADSKTALLVATGDVEAIAHAIGRMICEKGMRQEMSQNAVRHASEYSWQLHAQRLREQVVAAVKRRRGE